MARDLWVEQAALEKGIYFEYGFFLGSGCHGPDTISAAGKGIKGNESPRLHRREFERLVFHSNYGAIRCSQGRPGFMGGLVKRL